jgi:integrase
VTESGSGKVVQFKWTRKVHGPHGRPRTLVRSAWGFTVQDGKRQVRRFKATWTKGDAQRELDRYQRETAAGLPHAVLTLGEAVERYLKLKARKKSLALDEAHLGLFKEAFGADTPLANVTAARISTWKAERLAAICPQTKQPYSAAAVNRPLAAVRHLLRLAHEEWQVIDAVPRIKLEREPQGKLRWLTQEEISALLAACHQSRNPELHTAVVLAINTALRRAELLGLTWDRVDLSRGVIRLEVTKSGERREVPLNADSYRSLVSLEPKVSGRVSRTRSIRIAFENAVSTAKLEEVTFHTLRHTFASWAAMKGVSLKELQELLGHHSLTMTMRYAHLSPEHLRSAVARLEGLTSETKPQASADESTDSPAQAVIESEREV